MAFTITIAQLLLFCIIARCAQAHDLPKRSASIFSWKKGEESKNPEIAVPGYLPPLKVHKYNGILINSAQGPPLYLSSAAPQSSLSQIGADEFATANLSPEHLQQLDLLNRIVAYLPSEDRLHEFDFTALLPYVELIPDDSLEKLQYVVESAKTKQKSKLLKVIGFLKAVKEKKLKPFKYVAHVGSDLIRKKKEKVQHLLHFGQPTTQIPQIVTEVSTFPSLPFSYANAFNPYIVSPNDPYFSSSVSYASGGSQSAPALGVARQPPTSADNSLVVSDSSLYRQPAQSQPERFTYTSPSGTHTLVNSNDDATSSITAAQNQVMADSIRQYQAQFFHNQYSSSAPSVVNYHFTPTRFTQQQLESQPVYQQSGEFDVLSQRVNGLLLDQGVGQNKFATPKPQQTYQAYHQNEKESVKYDANQRENVYEHKGHHENWEKPRTPADTYLSTDLSSSASENIEKINGHDTDALPTPKQTENSEKHSETNEAIRTDNNYQKVLQSTPTPKITKLQPVKNPVYVFPETSLEKKAKGNPSLLLYNKHYSVSHKTTLKLPN